MKKETVSIELDEIEDIIKKMIREKYKFGDDIDLHRTSKTYFLTYAVIRNGDTSGCECESCLIKRRLSYNKVE